MSYDSVWHGIGDDNEEENTEYESTWTSGRDALLLVIDVTDSMFLKEKGESAFDLSIKCARNVMANKIFSSDRDLVGIVFFGTREMQNPADLKCITVFQDLEQPDAERILKIEKMMGDGTGDFDNTYGHSTAFSLSEVLWTCSLLFSNCALKLGSKRILLFTNDDNPHKGNVQLQHLARQKASDLFETGIELDLLHLKNSHGVFNVSCFYKDLIFLSEDEDYINIQDPSSKFDELMSRIRTKDHKKRRMSRLNFSLGKDVNLGVAIYALTRTARLPYATKLNKASNEEVKTMRKTYLEDTGEILMPSDIKKYLVYSGKKILLEQEEVKDLKRFFDPGLILMGFKPRSKLKDYHYLKAALFLYPDEESTQGSTVLFAALLKKCLERNVIAICHLTPRRNTPPYFVALLPQEEELSENKVQLTPPGFHVIFLPFSDNIRALNIENNIKATGDQVDKAKQILKKIKFKFSSEAFENPVLQTHWNNIEALALDREKPETINDYTEPNHEIMAQRMGSLAQDFLNSVYPSDYNPGDSSGKRKTNQSYGGIQAKRSKAEDEELVSVNIKTEAKNGTLSKWSVKVLKEFCQKVGIKSTGLKKAELIDAINDFLNI